MKKQVATDKKTSEKAKVKAKVGRPRKTDKSPIAENAAAVGKMNRLAAKRTGTSTRDLIIASANKIINRTGVVDFRIETLAQSLGLSPGNITYHFPKKEDIIAAIWEEYLTVMGNMGMDLLTPLLDIKQLFLFYRASFSKVINYVGVTTYYYGDMGALLKENEFYREKLASAKKQAFASYDILQQNGYLIPITDPVQRELTFSSQHIMFKWWINHALAKTPQDELPMVMDKYIALSLLQFIPFLTEEGREQFKSIKKLIV